MIPTIVSITTACDPAHFAIAEKYWAYTLDSKGRPVYANKTPALCAENGITQVELQKLIKATVTFSGQCGRCNCGMTTAIENASREKVKTGYPPHYYGSLAWLCEPCKALENKEAEERRAAYALQAEQDRRKAQERREKCQGKVVSKYGKRYMGNCPACNSGVLVLRINGATLGLFKGCSGWTNKSCSYNQAIPPEQLKQHQDIFLTDLLGIWGYENAQCTPEVVPEMVTI